MTELVICDECGEEIDPPESQVKMARLDGYEDNTDNRRLVFHYHVDCAPDELVGVWERIA